MTKTWQYGASEIRHDPGDAAVAIGWDYFDRLGRFRKSTQVYTPYQIVSFMVKSAMQPALEQAKKEGKTPMQINILDPCCGGGIFLIYAIREMHRLTGISKAEIAEHCITGIDIDIGAVITTRQAIMCEVDRDVPLNVLWGDSTCGYYEPSDHLTDTSDMAACNRLNIELERRSVIWMRHCMARSIQCVNREDKALTDWPELRKFREPYGPIALVGATHGTARAALMQEPVT